MSVFIKVSVVIPVYNVQEYLAECLESVIAQELKEIEIICVNDASTDKSEEIIQRYRKLDERIVWINNEKNRGLSYARNTGRFAAKGKYIYFLDSDDKITEDALNKLYKAAEEGQLDGIFFDASLLIDDMSMADKCDIRLHQRTGISGEIQSGKHLLQQFLENNNFQPSIPQQFWKKSFLDENGLAFFEGILHEDELFSFQAIIAAANVRYMKNVFFMRRVRAGSIMTRKLTYKNFIGYWTCFYYMALIASENEFDNRDLIDGYVARLYNNAVDLYEKFGNEIILDDFANQQLKESFPIFRASQKRYLAYGLFSQAQLKIMREYSEIYIYGTGNIAKSVFESLVHNGLIIEGFVVTKIDNGIRAFMGHRVYSFAQMKTCGSAALFLVSTRLSYQADIIALLEKNNMRYLCWEDNSEMFKRQNKE